MTVLVVLLGIMVGLAWLIPDDKAGKHNEVVVPFEEK